jgi:DUF1680 family protein
MRTNRALNQAVHLLLSIATCGLASRAWADALWLENPKLRITNKVTLRAQAFDLRQVRLLDGPFKHAQELDRKYLLELDPDRLLHTFRLNAGLPSSAQPLGGWEEPKCELRGHFTGHYLTACALMYASTGDPALKAKVDAVVAGLAECQAKLGSGYLSAFPEEFIDRVERQQRVWAPYYTLHKLFAGLLDAYVYCDNAQALEVARKFGDWVIRRNARLNDEQMQRMLGNEHGGMNECLANLYALTGEPKYLQIAQRFNHRELLDAAAQHRDNLTGKHANTQFPKFIGAARQYELTGDPALHTAATFFWRTVVHERSYVIGGNSDGEMFTPKERLSTALGPNTTETCNTYNMLKLTRHLFAWDPQAEYADYYERALYNHILASQHPDTGMMCYYVPLRSGSRKHYSERWSSFWCCTGTGIENHAKYGDSIYFHDADRTLYVNLFIASELRWPSRGFTLRQQTRYPLEDTTRLSFSCTQPLELTVQIRCPWWAEHGIRIAVNGQPQITHTQPGSYVSLNRTWRDGDTVQITLPFSLRAEGFKDNPNRFAVLHGPLVLCAEVDPKKPIPTVVGTPQTLLASLKPVAGRPSTFRAPANLLRRLGEPDGVELVLEPFYQVHGPRHYMVYFDALTPEQWEAKQKEHAAQQAREQQVQARTVDRVQHGDEANERQHNLRGERMAAGPFNDRHWRHATDGGWFAWDLKVAPAVPQELLVTYWGSDAGNRVFDILVDGQKLATQRLQNNRPGQFYDEVYPIPSHLTEGKQTVTVRFQAHPGAWAGGVFGVRIVKAAP